MVGPVTRDPPSYMPMHDDWYYYCCMYQQQ